MIVLKIQTISFTIRTKILIFKIYNGKSQINVIIYSIICIKSIYNIINKEACIKYSWIQKKLSTIIVKLSYTYSKRSKI